MKHWLAAVTLDYNCHCTVDNPVYLQLQIPLMGEGKIDTEIVRKILKRRFNMEDGAKVGDNIEMNITLLFL